MTEVTLLGQAIWAAAILIGIITVSGAAVAIVGLIRAPEAISNVGLALVKSEGVTQTIIALVIIGSVLALTLLDKIPAAAGIGVLSAIAGYVFGDLRRHGSSKDHTPQSN